MIDGGLQRLAFGLGHFAVTTLDFRSFPPLFRVLVGELPQGEFTTIEPDEPALIADIEMEIRAQTDHLFVHWAPAAGAGEGFPAVGLLFFEDFGL